MKHLSYLGLFFLLAVSCEVIDDPYADSRVEMIDDFGDPAFNDTFSTDFQGPVYQKIVLEDFTGHTCPNCPRGSDLAKAIQDQNPNNLIIVGIHNSEDFSAPKPDEGFPANYETETGENLRVKYNMNFFPSGMINRLPLGQGGTYAVSWVLWQQEINRLLADSAVMKPKIKLNFKAVVNSDIRLVRVFTEAEALENLVGNYYLSFYILESGIVSPQIDSRRSPSKVPDYVHNHVLRVGFELNEIGVQLFENPIANQIAKSDSVAFADFQVPQEWNLDSLELVGIIYENSSGEIIQANAIDLH